ncbi:MAG TPA: SCO family protein [Gemmatimonadales bacterium]
MRAQFRKTIGLAAAAFAAAAVLGATPARASGLGGPDYFTNLPLTTQDGKVVHFYDDLLKDKTVVINLIYTHCTASCPLETAKLSQVQKILGDRVGKDVFFYSISIDPEHDTPEALKAYARRFHVKPGWLFLTGKKDDIRVISKKLGLASLTDRANRDGHQPELIFGRDSTGQWMRNSAMDNPRFLAATITHFVDGYKAAPVKSYAELGDVKNIDKGEYMFKSRCAACHTIGKGDSIGPDLANVFERRDHAWVARYITAPDQVLDSGDPIAKALFARFKGVRMPNLDMRPEDMEVLLPYLERQTRTVPTSAPKGSLSAR